jgi:hypothetical protein
MTRERKNGSAGGGRKRRQTLTLATKRRLARKKAANPVMAATRKTIVRCYRCRKPCVLHEDLSMDARGSRESTSSKEYDSSRDVSTGNATLCTKDGSINVLRCRQCQQSWHVSCLDEPITFVASAKDWRCPLHLPRRDRLLVPSASFVLGGFGDLMARIKGDAEANTQASTRLQWIDVPAEVRQMYAPFHFADT